MKTTEDTAQGQPQVGTNAGLEHMLAMKEDLERRIDAELDRIFPEGARVTYKTWNMKHDRWATVSGAGLYCGSPYVSLRPDHNPKVLRRVWMKHVSVL